MFEFYDKYYVLAEIFRAVVTSIWFSFCIRLIFLLIFLKVADLIISKIQTRISQKTTSTEAKRQIRTIFEFIKNFVFFAITTMFVLAFLGKLGIDIKPFLATAGVAGLAIGFASKRFIEDLIEGIIIITSGQIRIGDYVEIAGKTGTVEKIDMKMVTLRATNGNVHFIRNGLIEIITNYTRDYSIALFDIGVGYDENPENVINVLKDIFYNELKKNEEINKKILSDIDVQGLTEFGESSITIRCIIKTLPKEQWAVQREFNKLVLERFKKENIEIPYPYRSIVYKNK